GQLRHIETDKSFEFNFSDDSSYNQKRYEVLGDLLTEYVYDLLETEVKLKKTYIPIDAEENEAQSFIFMSEDALTNPEKLLVLIHGSGVVRAGQWARRVIINDCLDNGTQLPFIKRGLSEGFGIIVLNTNLNSIDDKPIRGSATSREHTVYVWEHFIQPSKAKHIAIVAHSFGGQNSS
uniref:Arb2 domain-containing protein n=1 Tax=Strigamia maritima TaxID=126957 RepID=T1IWQ9_STRMM